MSYVRSDGYTLKDPDDDEAFQVVIGDLQRLALNLARGTANSAYQLTPAAATAIGTPPVTFLKAANNLSDVASTVAAAFNLGVIPMSGYTRTGSYTSGSAATHSFGASSRFFIAFLIGGGGAGSEGSGTGSGHQGGGGGGSGERVYCFGKIADTTLTYTVGAGGASAGANGASSSITHNSVTISAAAGGGGGVGAGLVGGDAGNTVGSTGLGASEFTSFFVVRIPGDAGQNPSVLTIAYNGAGAVSAYTAFGGLGGLARNAVGFKGGGGNGGIASASGAWNAGLDGMVQVYEI